MVEKEGDEHGYLGLMVGRIRGGIRAMVGKRQVRDHQHATSLKARNP
jgi:hypothetical protein